MLFVSGLILALLIGVVLGLIGGGGSILSLPLLHYLFGISILQATTYSLVIVGAASLVGVFQKLKHHEVAFREGIIFAVPSTIILLLTRRFVIPAIPENFTLFTYEMSREITLTVVFVVLLLITALRLVIKKEHHIDKKGTVLQVVLYGSLTGVLAGLIGAGGGFIIVPILISTGLTMKRAIGTSMFIISIQAFIGLIGDYYNPLFDIRHINFTLLLSITGLTIVGVLLGGYLQRFFKGTQLRIAFAVLLFCLGSVIIFQLIAY